MKHLIIGLIVWTFILDYLLVIYERANNIICDKQKPINQIISQNKEIIRIEEEHRSSASSCKC